MHAVRLALALRAGAGSIPEGMGAGGGAQARGEQVRCAERPARSRAGMLQWNLAKSRGRLKAAFEEVKEVRRAAKGALISQAEVARLKQLLSEAGVDSRKRSTILSLCREVCPLRQALVPAKGTSASVRRRTARLPTAARELQTGRVARGSREEALQAHIEKLRSPRRVLVKALFASKSVQRDKPSPGRQRGPQGGAPGQGRPPRCGLREIKERRTPPKEARGCSCCGKPYGAHGKRSPSLVEIQVKAHLRRIERTRGRRGCGGASAPLEVTGPPVPRLFPGTLYGTRVWARLLFEPCAYLCPLSRVSAWLANPGVPISPGTLADRRKHFGPLFRPLPETLRAPQNRTGGAMPTRPVGGCRSFARAAGRVAPGFGLRSARRRSPAISPLRAAPRSPSPCAAPRGAPSSTPEPATPSPCSASPPPSWQLAPRDQFIGWTPDKRENNLPLVVDNPRFLLLPWIAIPNLGSYLLALVRRRPPGDWTERSHLTPVLIETFVETPRYPAPSTRRQAGFVLEPPRDEDATTATCSATRPKRTSRCGRSGETGSKHSIVDIVASMV